MATLNILTVADSISKLVVSGLTIKDADEIPAALEGRDCPVMFLDPDNPISFDPVDVISFGGLSAKMDAHYTLNYILVYSLAGAGRTNKLEKFAGMLGLAADVVEAIMGASAITGAVNWNASIGNAAVLTWGDKSFDSISISISITEFVN